MRWRSCSPSSNTGNVDLTERYEWQGRQIAWGRAGDGPAVVFCHGTPWSSVLWRPIADALTDRYTVYIDRVSPRDIRTTQ